MTNEPESFSRIKWGTDITELKGMHVVDVLGDIRVYGRSGDLLIYGGDELLSISYLFFKDRFHGAQFSFSVLSPAGEEYTRIKDTLLSVYGKENIIDDVFTEGVGAMCKWDWPNVSIDLIWTSDKPMGTCSFLVKPIVNEIKDQGHSGWTREVVLGSERI